MLGGGAGLICFGLAWNSEESSSDAIFSDNFDTEAALILIGGASMVASVPFFIASARNKNKAKQISLNLNMEKNQAVRINNRYKSFPSVSLSIPLGR